jgi:hypothetical protein
LINGSPYNCFGASRGIRKGCPLSPFHLLLIEKFFIKLMHHARIQREIKGLKVSLTEVLSHILFIDDVLLFGAGLNPKFQGLRHILDLIF